MGYIYLQNNKGVVALIDCCHNSNELLRLNEGLLNGSPFLFAKYPVISYLCRTIFYYRFFHGWNVLFWLQTEQGDVCSVLFLSFL